MDLFGLLEVEPPPRPVTPWSPAALRHVPFGDAVFTLLVALTASSSFLGGASRPRRRTRTTMRRATRTRSRMGAGVPRFGAWQPLFQPYFPEWRENLEFPEPEPREGEFIFRVSLGKVWRLIAMPADSTLDDLVGLILHSVDFDDDHLYEFTYRDRLGAKVTVVHPAMDEGPWADQVPVGTLPLEPGQTMQLCVRLRRRLAIQRQAGTDRAARRQGQEAAPHPGEPRQGTAAVSELGRVTRRKPGATRGWPVSRRVLMRTDVGRKFRVADALILVAATAVGLAASRAITPDELTVQRIWEYAAQPRQGGWSLLFLAELIAEISSIAVIPTLASWTLACLLLRLRGAARRAAGFLGSQGQ